jgi:propanediol utilization protein
LHLDTDEANACGIGRQGVGTLRSVRPGPSTEGPR